MLSASPPYHNLALTTLIISSTSEANSVVVSESTSDMIQVRQDVLGVELVTSYPKALVTSLRFYGGAGDDRFINETDIELFAEGNGGDDYFQGGSGDDILHGGDGNDTIRGGAGADYIAGNLGDDHLTGGAGDDLMFGGVGDDHLEGHDGDDTLYGGDGNDRLDGNNGDDHLEGNAGRDIIHGGIGNDKLYGHQGSDILIGEGGANYIEGNDGNDYLSGGSGADRMIGGEGNDRILGFGGDDRLTGGNGNDVIYGHDGDDMLEGGLGDDAIYGGAGGDSILGHDGNDNLHGEGGDDYIEGNAGDDLLVGGDGDDRVIGGVGVDRIEGNAGNDKLSGGDGDDLLIGGKGKDQLEGDAGNDIIYGGADDDIIYGHEGSDTLDGEAGDDYIEGNTGDDRLIGGSGDDRMIGGEGVDRLDGDSGEDWISGGGGADLIYGGADDDVLEGDDDKDLIYGGDGDDRIFGYEGDDILNGEAGDDFIEGNAGADRINGGTGIDRILGGEGDDRLEGQAGSDWISGGDGVDLIFGGDGNDMLEGDLGNDLLYGGDGDDALYGHDGVDILAGQWGDDYIDGGGGADRIEGGLGVDRLLGGEGDDRIEGHDGNDWISGGNGADLLLGGDGSDQIDGENGNDFIYGGENDDLLFGQDGADTIFGQEGDDYIEGNAGDDRVYGGADDDRILGGLGDDLLQGHDGDDWLSGGAGLDLLFGDLGNDQLEGEAEADVLVGGHGVDLLFGGDGADMLIGGGDIDTLYGEGGEDLMIGASTEYDTNLDALIEAIAVWAGASAYEERIEQLSDPEALIRFIPVDTIQEDLVADQIEGGADRDWFVLSASNGVYSPLGPGVVGGEEDYRFGRLLSSLPALEGFDLIDSIDELKNLDPSETIHTLLPHPDSESKLLEHLSLFQLVRYADVTHTAVASGDWSDPSTWANGSAPSEGARVLIPYGTEVTIDGVSKIEFETIRVDGALGFATDVDTELRVDTMVVTDSGRLTIGSAAEPVQRGVTARLVFTDNGAIDRQADPFGLGRGLITHGAVEMLGAEVTAYDAAASEIIAGDNTILLASAPIGWAVGDTIVIAGTAIGGGEDEVREILAIDGATVTIDPLDYSHTTLEQGLEVHLANLSRNVVIESEGDINSRLGHVMFMHNRDVHIGHVAFNNLGRTDKDLGVTDSAVDSEWNLIEGTGDNQRARYAVHFHRNGVRADSAPSTVYGSVVNGSPGWGFVNHSSYVNFTDNVSYGVNGAAYVAEAGNEIGLFDSNIALHTTGANQNVDDRQGRQDFGFNGEGFWLQSPGVEVTNNVVSGSEGSAYIYYTRGFKVNGYAIPYLAENLYDPSLAQGQSTIAVDHAPILKFEGNVGYASRMGLTVQYNLRDAPHSAQSVLSDSTFWNTGGVSLPYANNTVLRDLTVLVDPTSSYNTGVDANAVTESIVYDNLRVEGYAWAILAAPGGDSVVNGGRYISKNWNIVVNTHDHNNRRVTVTGDPFFGSVTGAPIQDVAMRFRTQDAIGNLGHVFRYGEVWLDYGDYSNHRLYFHQQRADYVPFPEAQDHIPSEYVGLTQSQLFDQFGIAVGGEIAPADAFTTPDTWGLVWHE
ncbi:Bifunctional hemolysin/adenylate cyclase precursor [Pseudobythopirellula maris]|uniref:Bifunctional hemolysin/adenylate cyclase n=1 Tax=Pseudobythopirellula maris TaxID=2527991 RepID=A0A5C5ZH68_9BACT|nr:G8 domain-containing protein [Pseudobythopirellula maris]TWT86556.1 Bifunctional hemolysin/adenylate cyclase precursor [Pseudobythopirellula maris]